MRHRAPLARPILALLLAGCSARFDDVLVECFSDCTLPNAEALCVDGACRILGCQRGYGDCNGDHADGCEVPLLDDPLSCGACGNACGACEQGSCVPVEVISEAAVPYALVTLAPASVIAAIIDSDVGSSIVRVSLDGNAADMLAPVAGIPIGVTSDGADVYWVAALAAGGLRQFAFNAVAAAGGLPRELGSGTGVPDSRVVLSGEFAYVDVDSERGSELLRVERQGGVLRPAPGWRATGRAYGLQGEGQRVVFGHVTAGVTELVAYLPGEQAAAVLASPFRGSVFRVHGDSVYFSALGGAAGTPLFELSLTSGEERRLGAVPHVVTDIVVRSGALYVVDARRGGLSRVDLSSLEVELLAGEQGSIANMVFDDEHAYFASRSRILRLRLPSP